jgi:uncharacterized membrane protein YfhO
LGNQPNLRSLKISLSPGEYELDDIKANVVTYDHIPEDTAFLKKNALQNVKVNGNVISGEIQTAQKGLLYLSVPYSAGWTAVVDGK